MYIQQLYTNCLAQAAYYIESEGEATIIDPLRDYEPYMELAAQRNAKIRYIFETHFHADFVSGHIDLARQTGATIVYGPGTKTNYPVQVAADEEVLPLGKISIKVLHTPGHTPESSCFLLRDEQGKDHALFSGDTLFVGDVGRPDLLDGVMSKEDLAGMMYDSLQNKILPLADDIILYPAHGPGSACGKNIGKETFSTIGEQKKSNYALQPMNKQDFIIALTEGIQAAPAYFFKDAALNKQGYPSLKEVAEKGMQALTVENFEKEISNGAVIIDTRVADVFENGFVPRALNFGLNGQYAIWAATLLDLSTPIVLVTEEGKEKESVVRLSRVGFDNIKGYLQGGMDSWIKAGKKIDMVISIEPEEFALDLKHDKGMQVLDVRKPNEYNDAHLADAQLFSLQDIADRSAELNPQKQYYVHCAGGYRSMIAASWLKSRGIAQVKNVLGGFSKIKELDVPLAKTTAKA